MDVVAAEVLDAEVAAAEGMVAAAETAVAVVEATVGARSAPPVISLERACVGRVDRLVSRQVNEVARTLAAEQFVHEPVLPKLAVPPAGRGHQRCARGRCAAAALGRGGLTFAILLG